MKNSANQVQISHLSTLDESILMQPERMDESFILVHEDETTANESLILSILQKVGNKPGATLDDIELPPWPELKIGSHALFQLPSPLRLVQNEQKKGA